MEITTDHEMLLKKFKETQRELNELELDSYRICSSKRKYENRSVKTDESLSEKDPHFFPSKYLLPKESSFKQPKEDCSSNSSEESTSEDELRMKKVYLQSAVRAVTQSKRDFISKQNVNKKVRLRNSRIFGMLQSTLQKFQDDAVKRKPQDLKRIAVELKVEAAKEDAQKRMEKEELDLNQKIKEKKLHLDCLEQMMDITESFHTWKCNMNKSLNFILTDTEPRIYYLPASHNVSTKKKLEISQLEMTINIVRQEKEVMNKLASIKDSFKAQSFCNEDENDVS